MPGSQDDVQDPRVKRDSRQSPWIPAVQGEAGGFISAWTVSAIVYLFQHLLCPILAVFESCSFLDSKGPSLQPPPVGSRLARTKSELPAFGPLLLQLTLCAEKRRANLAIFTFHGHTLPMAFVFLLIFGPDQ